MILKLLKITKKLAKVLGVIDAVCFFVCYFLNIHEGAMLMFMSFLLNVIGYYMAKQAIQQMEKKQ